MKTPPSRTLFLSGMDVKIHPDPESASIAAAQLIEQAIVDARAKRGKAVLGLATGSTPKRVYAHLVDRHRAGALSFRDVSTYNLDEYYPIAANNPLSYHTYMYDHLFSMVDLAPERAHILDGTISEGFVGAHAALFERSIEADGGLDVQLLGIGRNGHIGFNEPCDLTPESAIKLGARLIELHPTTKADSAAEFGSVDRVIPRALTLGIATILSARSIIMLATGGHKAEAVAGALLGVATAQLPASLLSYAAARTTWLIDHEAARGIA